MRENNKGADRTARMQSDLHLLLFEGSLAMDPYSIIEAYICNIDASSMLSLF